MSFMAIMFEVDNAAKHVLDKQDVCDFVSLEDHSICIPKVYEQLFHSHSSLFYVESDNEYCERNCFGEETSHNSWEQQIVCYEDTLQEQVMELDRLLKKQQPNQCLLSPSRRQSALIESKKVSQSCSSLPFVNICLELLKGTKTKEEIQELSNNALKSVRDIQEENKRQAILDIRHQLLRDSSDEQDKGTNNHSEEENSERQHFGTASFCTVTPHWTKHWIQLMAHVAITMLECTDPSPKKNIWNIERCIISLQEVSDDYNQLSEARRMMQSIILEHLNRCLPQTASYLITSFDLDTFECQKTPTTKSELREEGYHQVSELSELFGTIPNVQGKRVLSGEVTPRTKAFLSGK